MIDQSVFPVLHTMGAALCDGLDPGALFDSSPIPTFVVNTDHVITHANRACANILGVRPQDMIGTRSAGQSFYGQKRPVLADFVLDPSLADQLDTFYPGHVRSSLPGPVTVEAEIFAPQWGAQGRWVFSCALALQNRQGKTVGAIQTFFDITERKRSEQILMQTQKALQQQLALAYDQLVQYEKLASIGLLAAGVAHEINNPIAYISSNFDMLEKYLHRLFEMLSALEANENTRGDAVGREALQALRQRLAIDSLKDDIPALMRESREGITRVRNIAQDLQHFVRVDATREWRFADLVRCIDATLNVVNHELKHKADVVRELVEVPDVECLASEINQVIMNLLVNAAQAIGPDRGTITVRNGTGGSLVWFEITDTGSGIEDANLARIFDPFYTTKPVGQGTGLGLSLSYGIVRRHQGQILVRTAVGKGSTFRVELPIVQPVPDSAETTPNP